MDNLEKLYNEFKERGYVKINSNWCIQKGNKENSYIVLRPKVCHCEEGYDGREFLQLNYAVCIYNMFLSRIREEMLMGRIDERPKKRITYSYDEADTIEELRDDLSRVFRHD